MKNATALLAGVITYALFAILFGMMSLGVGFMPDPSRTIYGYVILLVPLVPAGFAVGYLARSHSLVLAAALALIALAVFLALAPGPMPFFLSEQSGPWVVVAQTTYQAALYLLVSVLAAWAGAKLRAARRAWA